MPEFRRTVVFFRVEEAGRVTVRGRRRNYDTPSCHTRSSFRSHRHAYLQPQTVYQSSAYRPETINKNTSGMVIPLSLIVTL